MHYLVVVRNPLRAVPRLPHFVETESAFSSKQIIGLAIGKDRPLFRFLLFLLGLVFDCDLNFVRHAGPTGKPNSTRVRTETAPAVTRISNLSVSPSHGLKSIGVLSIAVHAA